MLFTIREMRAEDIPATIEILKQCGLFEPTVDTPERLRNKLEKDHDLMLVAETNGKVVGLVIGQYDGWTAFIWHLCVHKKYESRGIGHALKDALHVRLKARGAEVAYSYILPENTRMLAIAKENYCARMYPPVIPIAYDLR